MKIANPDGTTIVVLADHLRNVDWKARNIQLIHRISDAELSEVVARIDALLVGPGEIEVRPIRILKVTFDRRRRNPVLREAVLDNECSPVPWLKGHRIEFDFR